jgi:hypothetical protein
MAYITDDASQNFAATADFGGLKPTVTGPAGRTVATETKRVSSARARLYANTLFAPAPVHYGARALGRAMKLVGL